VVRALLVLGVVVPSAMVVVVVPSAMVVVPSAMLVLGVAMAMALSPIAREACQGLPSVVAAASGTCCCTCSCGRQTYCVAATCRNRRAIAPPCSFP